MTKSLLCHHELKWSKLNSNVSTSNRDSLMLGSDNSENSTKLIALYAM